VQAPDVALHVYRCAHCGREVLVRIVQPLTAEEVRRRIAEEMQPESPGAPARPQWQDRLRDDIWQGVSNQRTAIPREQVPDACPTCARSDLIFARIVDQD